MSYVQLWLAAYCALAGLITTRHWNSSCPPSTSWVGLADSVSVSRASTSEPESVIEGLLPVTVKFVLAVSLAPLGSVTVNSTCRSRRHNARVGGARRSQHLTGNAVDFRVRGSNRAVYAYLRSHGQVGGLKHYGGGLFHIDTGPRRTW